jgi:hypothetical protein
MFRHLHVALLLGLAVATAACGNTASSTGSATPSTDAALTSDATTDASSDAAAPAADTTTTDALPKWSDLQMGEVREIFPGGDTTCALGGKYAFFVRRGKTNKLLLDFQGGGACWNALTCQIGKAICTQDIGDTEAAVKSGYAEGIYDYDNPKNPFADWTHVIIPYCTCDIHWGNAVATYGEGDGQVTIHHKGAVNTQAVLAWVYANLAKPERIFVTGCSAGAYGSIVWSAFVAQHYPGVPVAQLGDSGAGIITPSFLADSFPSWNALKSLPGFIPALAPAQIDLPKMVLGDIYHRIAAHFPNFHFSQYTTAFDENQVFYFKAMGGSDANAWNTQMTKAFADIHASTPNFRSFIAPGELHCIEPFPQFYDVQVGGQTLVDWVAGLANGASVTDVACQGKDCAAK